jgi:hypothetical protein
VLVIIATAVVYAAVGTNPVAAREATAFDTVPVPAGCPYDFASDMPAATFCVYNGVALDTDGAVCAKNVVIMWSSFAGPADASNSPQPRELYVGFVAQPDLILRGTVGTPASDTAQLTDVDAPERAAPIGEMKLRAVQEKSDVLSMDLHDIPELARADCVVASYSGTFVGLLRPPTDQTMSSVDR